MKIVVSSYNQKPNESLTLFDIDLEKQTYKKLDDVSLNEPSFVISQDNIVFTYDKKPLRIKAFKVKDYFELLDEIDVPLETMTHLNYNYLNHRLYGASYADGSYICVDFRNTFSDLKCYYQGGKCHCVALNEELNEIAIVNISLDKIFIYDNNMLLLRIIDLPSGIGPRHAIYRNHMLYIVTEYSNEIVVLKNDKIIQRISTLNSSNLKSNGATLLFSKDNKYLYACNRGEDSIACFLNTNILKYNQSFACNGKHPRHMIITKDGKYLICCNKNSHNIAIIDLNTQKEVLDIPYNNVSSVCEICPK